MAGMRLRTKEIQFLWHVTSWHSVSSDNQLFLWRFRLCFLRHCKWKSHSLQKIIMLEWYWVHCIWYSCSNFAIAFTDRFVFFFRFDSFSRHVVAFCSCHLACVVNCTWYTFDISRNLWENKDCRYRYLFLQLAKFHHLPSTSFLLSLIACSSSSCSLLSIRMHDISTTAYVTR